MTEETTQRRVYLTKDLKRDIQRETDIANESRKQDLNTSEEITNLIADGIKYREEKRKALKAKGKKK